MMTYGDLTRAAAALQRTENPRKAVQAAAINALHQEAIKLEASNVERLGNDILVSRAAEKLYASEKDYCQALERLTGAGIKSLLEEARVRMATLVKYIPEKFNFSRTQAQVERYFSENLSFPEFLGIVRSKSFYLYVDDEVLQDVYEMLLSKSLV